jgi:hypothetical protein
MSRNVGFLQLRRGLWDHLRTGRMTPLETLAFIYICSEADTRTGVWKGSAGALVGELGFEPRTARDVLERMERDGYIRRFAVPGSHICYPILVHKYLITNGEHNGEQLNALSSTFINGCVKLAFFSREEDVEVDVKVDGELDVEENASQKRSENREVKRKKREQGKAAASLPQETIKLLARLEVRLQGQLSGWDWSQGQTGPEFLPILEWFKLEARAQGIDWRKAERLYNDTMANARKAVEPTELKSPFGPFTEDLLERWALEAASNAAVLDVIRDPDNGSLTIVFADGFEEFYVGENEPFWFAYDNEAAQERSVDVPVENLEQTGTFGTISC